MVWLVVLWFPNPLCLILAHVSSMYHPLILKFLTWIFLDGSSQIISDIRDIIIFVIIQLQPPIPTFILSLWFSLYPFFFWLENSFDKFSYNMRRNFNWALFVGSGIPIRSKVCTKIFRALEKNRSAASRFVLTISLWFAPIQHSSYVSHQFYSLWRYCSLMNPSW